MVHLRFLKTFIPLFLSIPLICLAQKPHQISNQGEYPHPFENEIKCSTVNDCTIVRPKCYGNTVDSEHPINKKFEGLFLKRIREFCKAGGYGITVAAMEEVIQCKEGKCDEGTCAQAKPNMPGWIECELYILRHRDLSPKRYTELLLSKTYDAIQKYKDRCDSYPKKQGTFSPMFILREDFKCEREDVKSDSKDSIDNFLSDSGMKGFDPFKDGWLQPIEFWSNGKSFKITASHGYWVSEKSKVQKNGLHWSNRNPPKEESTFNPDCYGYPNPNCPNGNQK